MNSTLLEDVQPWTNSKKQTKWPVSVNINIKNVSKIIAWIIRLYHIVLSRSDDSHPSYFSTHAKEKATWAKRAWERSTREWGEEAHSLPRQASRFTLASSSLAILSARRWNENREKIEGCEQSITFGYLFECFKALFSPQFSLSSWSWQIYSSYTAWNKFHELI